MDFATLLGLITGVAFVGLGIAQGDDPSIFINIPGVLIVVGGTISVTLVKYRIASFFSGVKEGFAVAFFESNDNPREIIQLANHLAKIARRNGLLGLEDEPIENPFFAKGIQLCVDGHPPEFIQKVLMNEMSMSIDRKELGEKIFRSMASSAPAFGMIGTLVGLVQMLNNLDDPSKLGPGMAVALLTTLYGSLIAQLFMMPLADKLALKSAEVEANMSLITESVLGIQEGLNPTVMDELLETYLPEYLRSGMSMSEEI